jgi:hypothetical protein
MSIRWMQGCHFAVAALAVSGAVSAQPASLSAGDRTAIQALVTAYAQALGGCHAEDFAELFVPKTGTFASGIRGEIVGHEHLMMLVQSERHCAPDAKKPAGRPGGANGPTVDLEVTPAGVRGVAKLGAAGEYQDEYLKTPQGWRFASRTVLTPPEKAAGLDASEMRAIRKLNGAEVGDYYVADENGGKRFMTSGVAIRVTDGAVTGRAYLKSGGYDDETYEKTASGQWRIKTRTHVAP